LAAAGEPSAAGWRLPLAAAWQLQSLVLAPGDGKAISSVSFAPRGWFKTTVPSTVLSALVKNGVYPDPRIGMNSYRIPDSSDEFNRDHDLAKFSHLPDQRNPWRDPWWFRREFTLPQLAADRHTWLHFNCINYRAEVWLNGTQIADTNTMVGMFQRFDFDITSEAKVGRNALAVKILPVDHPGVPETQTEPLGKDRGYQKDIMKDVTMVMTIGYDCAPTVPDRNMGIIQDVWVDESGPVIIRHPFVKTELPLPETNRAIRFAGRRRATRPRRRDRGEVRAIDLAEAEGNKGNRDHTLSSLKEPEALVATRLWTPGTLPVGIDIRNRRKAVGYENSPIWHSARGKRIDRT
jgi:hypothetical protein